MQSHLGTKQIDPHSKLNTAPLQGLTLVGRKDSEFFLVQTFNGIFPGSNKHFDCYLDNIFAPSCLMWLPEEGECF